MCGSRIQGNFRISMKMTEQYTILGRKLNDLLLDKDNSLPQIREGFEKLLKESLALNCRYQVIDLTKFRMAGYYDLNDAKKEAIREGRFEEAATIRAKELAWQEAKLELKMAVAGQTASFFRIDEHGLIKFYCFKEFPADDILCDLITCNTKISKEL